MANGKVALVTGASSGIGAETARLLQAQGFVVYAVARRPERLQALADLGVHVFALDVTDDALVTVGVEKILAETGRIDLLVNNAGYGSFGSVEDVPLDEARRQFEVNVFGLARLIQLVVPRMRAQGNGRIINVSSIGGKIYEPLGAWYHATKFAVEGLSDSLRIELRPFGIDVVLVEPGPILSEWTPSPARAWPRRRPAALCALARSFPTGRWTPSSPAASADRRSRRRGGRERMMTAEPDIALPPRFDRRAQPVGRPNSRGGPMTSTDDFTIQHLNEAYHRPPEDYEPILRIVNRGVASLFT